MSRPARTVRLVIAGQVQGVGYRIWATRTAASLGLDGWVRNLRDGTVELVASGTGPAVAAMIEACGQGPTGATVTALDIFAAEPDGSRGFTARPTE